SEGAGSWVESQSAVSGLRCNRKCQVLRDLRIAVVAGDRAVERRALVRADCLGVGRRLGIYRSAGYHFVAYGGARVIRKAGCDIEAGVEVGGWSEGHACEQRVDVGDRTRGGPD